MNTRFRVGDRVFMASAGVARVSDVAGKDELGKPAPLRPGGTPVFLVVESESVTACVPIQGAEKTLRPLMERTVASEVLALLRAPFEPALDAVPLLERGKQIVHEGHPLEQARFLRELYALPVPVHESLATGLTFVENLVLGELAEVLGVGRSVLGEEMRALHPAASDVWERERSRIRFRPRES